MTQIQLFTADQNAGFSSGQSVQLRKNVYVEQGGDSSALTLIGMPGDTLGVSQSLGTSANLVGATHTVNGSSSQLVVDADGNWAFNDLYGGTSQGTGVWGSGVSLSTAQATVDAEVQQICGVTYVGHGSINGFWYSTGPARVAITPQNPSTFCFVGQRMILAGQGSRQFNWSDLGNYASWPALNVAQVSYASGKIVFMREYLGVLVILCEWQIEIWQVTSDANNPYAPILGSFIPVGCRSYSNPVVFGGSLYFLAAKSPDYPYILSHGNAQFTLMRLTGTSIEQLTPPQVEFIISSIFSGTGSQLGFPRICGEYEINGHSFIEINKIDKTSGLVYDVTSNSWSIREYVRLGSVPFAICRHPAIYAGDKDTRKVLNVYKSGSVLLFRVMTSTSSTYGPSADPIGYSLVSPHYVDPNSGNRSICTRLRVNMDLPPVDATLYLSISRDRGNTYGSELPCVYGSVSGNRAEWRRLGAARDFVFKLRQSGGRFVCLGGFADFEQMGK